MTGPGHGLDDELAEARLDAAADARRRRRAEAELATMEASLVGLLAGWAAVGATVTVEASSGRSHTGRITAIGDDVVLLVSTPPATSVLRLATIVGVRSDAPLALDTRTRGVGGSTMVEVLAGLAGTRRQVEVVLAGGSTANGEIEWCGDDVVCVVGTRRDDRRYLYVASVNEVSFSLSTSSA